MPTFTRISVVVLFIVSLPLRLLATEVKLEWDPSPSAGETALKYRLYKDGELLTTVDGLTTTVDIEKKSTFYVTAYDPEGDIESEPSNSVTWFPRPKPPALLKLSVVADLSAPANQEAVELIAQQVKALLDSQHPDK